ncbi:hypothetical protein C8Q69DRAFT_27201 [Paecilomyces variotii]|uniref:Rhodopsin domain-containing protein n=1 Tax=Byssochlamys spectabilis TaxID=264951 RepID=A0A443I665_BYSSP|nr:hypothetical protein C8Q69DRAFT_27201 [Paecilomyces variotii]KAJ9224378.1 hypothetical protein DTO169C6_3209 [Paecilomyces variotii]KAJ9354169.1 hypothetical protein DTO280E4_7051 [Paecilomyces variotii]KAJ9410144.1 hypothetical protein DTO045G8_2137 [Paecilomyces variotii]RWQ99496.1 hypothetical protein C8Q69DRAFT_27201 [Paecilomyces variotii]
MDIPRPSEGDVNIGTDIVRVCWVLTGIVGVVLIFRFSMKAWIRWALPQVSAPERVWGFEDLIFLFGYSLDLLHMTLIQLSYQWGLGRHFYYLSPTEKVQSLRFDFASQPTAVAAAMVSRTGMMWFLYQCFSASDRRIRLSIIISMIIQVIANALTIVQIVVQCGPNPYRPADRTKYFHYMWDPLPADGSVKCQSPNVQTTVGFVQGGFNTSIDFFLGVISAFELWQFFIQTLHRNPNVSVWTQFKRLNSSVRSRRIWQTISLSVPLFLSGAASIVKTYLLKSLGDRLDFTYNIVHFILWVKIENYSILIATCAPVIRLFLRTFVDNRRDGRYPGYPWSRSHSSKDTQTIEMGRKTHRRGPRRETSISATPVYGDKTELDWDHCSDRSESRIMVSSPDQTGLVRSGQVTVKTDIVVEVDDEEEGSSSMSSGPRESGGSGHRDMFDC